MRRILTLLLAVLTLAALAVPAAAADETDLVLRLEDGNVPLSGAKFELYRVGEKKQDALVLTGKFAAYPVDLNTPGEDRSAQAEALYGFARKDGLTPDKVLRTDALGTAVAEDLAPGLYLLGGEPLEQGGSRYNTEPQLILLPQKDPATGAVLDSPVLNVKFSKEPVTGTTVTRKVLKIWDDCSGYIRPASVTVHLLKNGKIFSTAVLNAANGWKYTWEGLDPSALWQLAEEVPAGYTVTLEQEGDAFLLTNSAPEAEPPTTEPETPTESTPSGGSTPGKIPQTGMLWWPVAVLGGLGLVLLLLGTAGRGGFRKVLILLAVLLLAAAGLLVAANLRQQSVAGETSREVVAQLAEALPEGETQPGETEIPTYQRDQLMDMPGKIIDGTSYIARLEIPALELDLPVISDTTDSNLRKAPCRYAGSAYRDDLVIGAHNYSTHFGRLSKLSYGDVVRVVDMEGNAFAYRVADIEILQPEQVDDLLGGSWPLTLYTCTPGGQSRITVRCEIM